MGFDNMLSTPLLSAFILSLFLPIITQLIFKYLLPKHSPLSSKFSLICLLDSEHIDKHIFLLLFLEVVNTA
jgi:hypothetical protein